MNDFNQSSNLKPKNQNQKTTSGFWTSLNYSIWGDPFSILKSPLFIVMTLLIVAITFLLSHYTQNPEISILSGLILELLTAMVTWQFLSISRRLESISTQTSDLQYTVQNSESEFKKSFSEFNLDFNKSQRFLEKMEDGVIADYITKEVTLDEFRDKDLYYVLSPGNVFRSYEELEMYDEDDLIDYSAESSGDDKDDEEEKEAA